jgi:hypothetical protein
VVTGAVALGGLAFAAASASASPAGISAIGGPGVLTVTGSGLTPNTTVAVDALVDNVSARGGPGDIGAAVTGQFPRR